jgi:Smg protein
MFDILAFLFEQYFSLDNCPDRTTLAKRLSAAGFEDQEIDEALDWLTEFDELDPAPYAAMDKLTLLPRLLHPREAGRLTPDAQAFFHYLSSSGALTTGQRELLIDRLMQSNVMQLDEASVKRVALMVLWRQGDDLANLLIEELLFAGETALMH